MIPVALEPEPASFEREVRKPGQRFLRRVQSPTDSQFKEHQYWKSILPDLREAYSEICAYCACWIPFEGSVDHFQPKSVAPAQAYEWSNYRFAQEKINNKKGNATNILDPFHVDAGWFVLDFSTMFVKPTSGLPAAVEQAVKTTIGVLDLNSRTLVKLRYKVVKDYSDGLTLLGFLERRYPFVAAELKRQGATESIKGTVR